MDRIELLRERKSALESAGKETRARIRELFDENSFVELAAFSFSGKEEFEGPGGEGVITGFATIGGYPFYLVAQNFEADFGGLTQGNCEKIARLIDAAEKNETPVVWLLHSQGAKIGEGVAVLEGAAQLLNKAAELKGVVPQYAIIGGEVYGAAAAIAAMADVVFFPDGGTLAVTSPLVLSAKSGKNLKKEEVGGYAALKNALLPAVKVKNLKEVSEKLRELTELFGVAVRDAELNEPLPALNRAADAKQILSLIEGGIELGANGSSEVHTVLGRIGGIAVAAAVFDGVRLNEKNLKKIRAFADLSLGFGLPLVLFVDCLGVEPSLAVNDSAVLREIAGFFGALGAIDAPKISVVTGRAVGLGYSLFAAKSAGFDYTYALATAEVSLFEDEAGAAIVYANEGGADREALLRRYREEHADPVHAAKRGYLDNVIEPQFLKQYLIASLQTLLR